MKKARRAAAKRGRRLRIMFGDEARFGRMNRPRPCWAPVGIRPEVACQLIREYVYLYGAVSPKGGTCIFLILPAPDTILIWKRYERRRLDAAPQDFNGIRYW